MQDTPTDDGSEQNLNLSWWSSDIWVGQNGGNPNNTPAQNPRSDMVNDIFVRVRNGPLSGASSTLDNKDYLLTLYWTHASTKLIWPNSYKKTQQTPTLGGEIGSVKLEFQSQMHEYRFKWKPAPLLGFPGYEEILKDGTGTHVHMCLLARIWLPEYDSGDRCTNEWELPGKETGWVGPAIQNYRRIANRNVNVFFPSGRSFRPMSYVLIGPSPYPRRFSIRCLDESRSVVGSFPVKARLGSGQRIFPRGEGIRQMENEVAIFGDCDFTLEPFNEHQLLILNWAFDPNRQRDAVFGQFDLIEYAEDSRTVSGGQRFVLNSLALNPERRTGWRILFRNPFVFTRFFRR